jgi:hypothetical protein
VSGLNAEMRINASNQCSSLREKAGRWQHSITLLLLLVGIISALFLAAPCAAQSGYEIRSAVVAPEYGYEDFTYSAQVWIKDLASRWGVINITQFSLKLNIYDNDVLIHTDSSDQTGMSKTSFAFGPYSFKDRFGVAATNNATFEFILNAFGKEVARTARIKGPIVQPPRMTGIQYEKKPYFFQGIVASAGFKDLDNLDPRPTCHLEITGPLGTTESRSWTTADVSCQASGKSTYSCIVAEDLSVYRSGGNFTFKLVYNNPKLEPLTYGPYNISLQPYNPVVERLTAPKQLDYTNFTIQAYVKDEGVVMAGGTPDGSTASLIISRPKKGEMAYATSEPTMRGSSLVYEWTADSTPIIFNRSDVQLSKAAPFQAKVVYKNEKWNYQAEKSNISFKVVEEIPKLDLQYPTDVYVRLGESTSQDIIATVTFSKGPGDMIFKLSGQDHNLNATEKGVPLGGNKYQYKWQVAFDDHHINNNYTLALSFVHPTLEGGSYVFPDKFIRVSPLSVQFSDGLVSPTTGLWNDSFTYSMKIDTTVVPLEVRLQTYDPCSSEWTDKDVRKATEQSSWLNWTLSPFGYECKDMQQHGAKYRFKASFGGMDYFSRPFEGPTFKGGSPVLISLKSDPVVYVPEGGESAGSISAIVEYGADQGQGLAVLRLSGPGKSIEESSQGTALGGNQYRFDWSPTFSEADFGKSFNYTIIYNHSSLAAEYLLGGKAIDVKSISIDFADATVTPAKGKWNDTYAFSVTVNRSVDMKVALEVYNSCSKEWVRRASGKASVGRSTVNLTAMPFKSRCADANGLNASYRFVASFEGEAFKSDAYSGPLISGDKAQINPQGSSGSMKGEQNGRIFNDSSVTVIGNVTPAIGVIQAWDERDPLHALTYTLLLKNWSSEQVPWIELSVRAYGSNWEIKGGKQRLNPATGSVSWTLKPFWDTPLLGQAQYRFLIDGAETEAFDGPDIIAVVSNAGDNLNGKVHDFWATVNSSENLTVCMVGGDNAIPELIKTWTTKGQCQSYQFGLGEKTFKWQTPEAQTSPYYDFDIQRKTEVPMQ